MNGVGADTFSSMACQNAFALFWLPCCWDALSSVIRSHGLFVVVIVKSPANSSRAAVLETLSPSVTKCKRVAAKTGFSEN